jgi:hypothetical protein
MRTIRGLRRVPSQSVVQPVANELPPLKCRLTSVGAGRQRRVNRKRRSLSMRTEG